MATMSGTYTQDYGRLIYLSNDSSTYTDYYHSAESSLKTAIGNYVELGTSYPSVSDGKVTFVELLCVGNN